MNTNLIPWEINMTPTTERERLLFRAVIVAKGFAEQFAKEFGEESFKHYFEKTLKAYKSLASLLIVFFVSSCIAATPYDPDYELMDNEKIWYELQDWNCDTDMECIEECWEKSSKDEKVPENMKECV